MKYLMMNSSGSDAIVVDTVEKSVRRLKEPEQIGEDLLGADSDDRDEFFRSLYEDDLLPAENMSIRDISRLSRLGYMIFAAK